MDGGMFYIFLSVCFLCWFFLACTEIKKEKLLLLDLKRKKLEILPLVKKQELLLLSLENSQPVSTNDSAELTKKEEAPSVLVIGADGNSAPPALEDSLNAHQNVMNAAQENQNISMEQSSQSQ